MRHPNEAITSFREFFQSINDGNTPFPWQEDLVEYVLTNGGWPRTIDVPTGLGKTNIVDVAVFLLASDAAAARRRIFFVVDRRLVVDEAHEHASAVAEALRDASPGSPLFPVAERLRGLSADATAPEPSEPLVVRRMRGGTTWDAGWVDRPDQPAIVMGTIDQVGSRLFFRGYGTTDQRKPMDAALTAIDSLILIDEAHLAAAFIDSLEQAKHRDTPTIDPATFTVPRCEVVRMSATPSAEPQSTTAPRYAFDIEKNMTHPVAAKRLTAPKRLRLAKVVDNPKMAATMAAIAVDMLKTRPGARALVVCNTVQRARSTRDEIERALRTSGLNLRTSPDDPEEAPQPELLIGRSRPVDRDQRSAVVRRRFGISRSRSDKAGVDVLVATQTVEVGANLDVDVLVTESAPLEALTQRLGRLNRLGDSALDPVAVVVHDGRPDAVYGDTRLAAWTYLDGRLKSHGIADPAETNLLQPGHLPAGPLALKELLADAPTSASTWPSNAPAVTRVLLDTWAQTGPIPDPDTPVAPYLHGRQERDTDVLVCWRDDIVEEDGRLLGDDRLNSLLSALSPVAGELAELPLRSVRSWLLGGKDTDAADFDGLVPATVEPNSAAVVVAYRDDTWRAIPASRIRPGEILVVPAQLGGLDAFGWNPANRAPVVDVWELAMLARGRLALRLDERTLRRIVASDIDPAERDVVDACSAALKELWKTLGSDLASAVDVEHASEEVVKRIKELGGAGLLKPGFLDLVDRLDGAQLSEIDEDMRGRALLTVHSRATNAARADDASEFGSSAGLASVPLDQHHDNVRRRAERIARNVNLSHPLTEIVAEAAGSHDLGKLDIRFQASLRGGDLMAALAAKTPLAKSGIDPRSAAGQRARLLARVPRGFRHEAWSAKLVGQRAPQWDDPRMHDLLIHLVASHHGHSRPLLPPVLDDDPQEIFHNGAATTTESVDSVDFDGPRRFNTLNAWLGRWGLAYLETIVRCADQTCSKEGT